MSYTTIDPRQPWWAQPKASVHEHVAAAIKALDEEQASRREALRHQVHLYSGRLLASLDGEDYNTYDSGAKLKLNLIKAVINTAIAQIATNRNRPMFLTQKGNRKKKQQGKKLGQFALGQFDHLDQFHLQQQVFKWACVTGSGFELIAPDYDADDTGAEVVPPDEVVVDPAEARYGKPRTMFRVKDVDPFVLAAKYPKHRQAIYESGRVRDPIFLGARLVQPVTRMESWRLPDKKGGKGRHIICTDSVTLVDEPWMLPRFPVKKFDWDEALYGYFGIGIAEELQSLQLEANYILQKVQKLMTLATSQVWVEEGSNIRTSKIGNEDFSVNKFKGRPPVFMTVASVSPEYFQQLDRIWERAFELAGVSMMAATGEKPRGLDSGTAIRNFRDVTSRRFLHVQQRFDDFMLGCTQGMIDAAREIEERTGNYKVVAQDRDGIEELRFADVNLDDSRFRLRVHPVSFLPDEPAGQMQTLKEFSEVSPEIGQQLISEMHYPDLDAAVARASASQEIIEFVISKALDDGEYYPPEPYYDLQAAMQRVRLAVMQAEHEQVDEANVDLLRQWLSAANKLANPEPQAGQMPAEAVPVPPQAGQMPPGGMAAPPQQLPPPELMAAGM